MLETLYQAVSRVLAGPGRSPVLRAIRDRASQPDATPRECFGELSDEDWYWLNTTGVQKHDWLRGILPKMPDAGLQATYTGSSGNKTLREGFKAYQLFRGLYERHVGSLSESHGVLDFGCGWGRIIRFFLKDLPSTRLCGVDHSDAAVEACRATNPWCRFELIEPHPPTPLDVHSFDLIYLYSVFSHLPEDLHWLLLEEFSRLLRPGGLLIATTRARDFIGFCRDLRDDPRLDQRPDWLKVSARAFLDADAVLAAYDDGQFCYGSHGFDGRWSFWGEACIPRGYVLREWTKLFDFCDYVDDRRRCPQNVIVVRRRMR